MTTPDSIVMDDAERDAFLGNGGTGVISFSTTADDPPHSIPVSYGYDAAEETFYFRLAVDPDSEKRNLAGRAASFVTHRLDEGGWQSVVARGQLESTMDEDIATETLQGLGRVSIPLVDIFGRPPSQITFEFFRLDPDELTGRKESPTGM